MTIVLYVYQWVDTASWTTTTVVVYSGHDEGVGVAHKIASSKTNLDHYGAILVKCGSAAQAVSTSTIVFKTYT